jgi:serine protease Do
MKKGIFLSLFVLFITSVEAQKLSALFEKVASSVVVITTENIVSASPDQVMEVTEFGGLGSGVLISDDGYIWTASHVVHSADGIQVKFNDGDRYRAEVVSTSPIADVAIIRVVGDFKLKKKHVAAIGDSDQMKTGEDLFVIGAPRGLEQTLSRGIVSGRIKPDQEMAENFMKIEYIQTDASINPGNSGGPMFNMKGEVIGIASFILSDSGGFDGIGFGATSNVAYEILMRKNRFWSGMEFEIITPDMAKLINLPQVSGLLVEKVAKGSMAYRAGIRGGYVPATIGDVELVLGGDVILEIDDIPLNSPDNYILMMKRLKQYKSGDSFVVKIYREGQELFELFKIP